MLEHTTPAQCFPLTFAASGETVALVAIHAGDTLRQRLTELGLHIGMTLRVVQGERSGALIVAVKNDTRLALGRGMAQKMMVTRAPRSL